MDTKNSIPSFWKWFFLGTEHEKPGIRSYFDRWLLLHLIVASGMTYFFHGKEVSTTGAIIISFIGILIAITMAWSSNLISLINSNEIVKLSKYYKGGITGYVFKVQSAVLAMFAGIIVWAIYCFTIFQCKPVMFAAFFLSSVVIRECWQAILFAHMLTICRAKIILSENERSSK